GSGSCSSAAFIWDIFCPIGLCCFRLHAAGHGYSGFWRLSWRAIASRISSAGAGARASSRRRSARQRPSPAVGYSLGAMIVGVAGRFFLGPGLGWLEALGLALALSILGQVGDLFESWIKRVFAVKDS